MPILPDFLIQFSQDILNIGKSVRLLSYFLSEHQDKSQTLHVN